MSLFPLKPEKRNIYLFYTLTVAMNMWFIASNWIFFWNRYMNYTQLGWADALGFGFALFLEVPSGAIADLIGKRKTIITGFALGAVGLLIHALAQNTTQLVVGWLLAQFCYAFYSGAAEAIVYDTLVDNHQEEDFHHVITKSSAIESYTGAITTLIGGFLFVLYFRLPSILWFISFVVGAIVSYFLIEPKSDTEKFSFKNYFNQLFIGIKELTQTGLKRYLGFFLVLVGFHFMYAWGFLRPTIAASFGFFAKEQSIILPLLTIMGALVVRLIPYFKKHISDIAGITTLAIIMAIGFLLASFPIGYFGVIAMILIAMAGKIASPWISIIVNKKIESKYRATTLSTVALITKLPYVLFGVIAGNMVQNGQLSVVNRTFALVIMLVTIFSIGYLFIKPKLATQRSV